MMALDFAPAMVSIITQLFLLCSTEHKRKNWVTINTIRGAQASAVIYSITETARANNLNVYYYIRHLLTELPQLIDGDGNIEQAILELLTSKMLSHFCS